MTRMVFLAFLLMPVIEIAILIQVGSAIGVLMTVMLILLTAALGTTLLRVQGLSILLRGRSALESRRVPTHEIAEGLALAIGGALLLTPGFVTDSIGFSLLVPASRRLLINWVAKRVTLRSVGASQPHASTSRHGRAPIEGEFRRED